MNRASATMVLAVLAVGAAGCTSWVEIKTTELPKLNGGAVAAGTVVSGTQRGEVVAVSVAEVEKPDGTLEQIKGEFDVRLTRQQGSPEVFESPVRSTVEGESLTIQSGNRARTSFSLAEIRKTEVSQPNATGNILIFAVGFPLAGVLVGLIAVAAM